MNKEVKFAEDQKRAGITIMFIVLGSFLSFYSSNTLTLIVRTSLVLTSFVVLFPLLKRKYKGTKDWKTFLVVSTLGVIVYLTDFVYRLFE